MFCHSREANLLVAVAISLSKRIHQFAENTIISNETKRNNIIQSHLSTRRIVSQRRGTLDNKLTAVDIQVLPSSPDVINHTMMKEKQGIGRLRVEICCIASHSPVTSSVDTEGVTRVISLHAFLKGL